MSRQRDAISSPIDNDGRGRRRADSAGQHNCLADQSFHCRGVGLVDGHFSQGQTEESGGDTRIERRKERRERRKDDQETVGKQRKSRLKGGRE